MEIDKIFSSLEEEYSLERVVKDFYEGLDFQSSEEEIENGIYEIIAFEDNWQNKKAVQLTRNEKITILYLTLKKAYQDIIKVPLVVRVGIGEFEVSTTGIYRVEKCEASLYYNEHGELFDIEFFYDPLYTK